MMATGGTPFEDGTDEQELHNRTISNGSLDDRLNNMDWGVQQKKANRSSEKNREKLSAMSESRLTNDISPESTPRAGRRRARTPHSFPHVKYSTQMSVPDQAELDRLRQVINFTDLDERSIGSDSQGRVTAANNQRQLSTEAKKPFNFLPIHLNTNKSKEPTATTSSTPGGKEPKKQSPGKELFAPVPDAVKEPFSLDSGHQFTSEDGKAELGIDSSQVVSKLVQIREYIGKATSMRDDLVEKNDVPANVERLSLLITHLKEQEKSYLRFLQKMLARENEDDDEGATVDSAVGSGSVAESTSLNLELRSEASSATGHGLCGEQKEELENMRKQHDLLKKMLEQQEQLRALQGRQAALLAMQQSAEQAIAVMDDTVVTETTGSVSGRSITSELNDELNDLIQRFHNQLHDSQSQTVPDNRRQAECLSLSREVCRSRTTHNSRRQLPDLNPAQPQTPSNWMDMNSLTKAHGASNNRDGRLNTECEINNRSAANLRSLNVPSVIECQFNRDRPYDGVKDEDDDEAQEDGDGARGGGGGGGGGGSRGRGSDGSGSSRRSSLGGDTDYAEKVQRLQTAKQKLRQLQELVAMVQSDDTDGTTANEDEGLKQQPNNTRVTAPKIRRDIVLSEKSREKLYEEKLKQQQQELKQLHEERQRLMEIQGKIQDLQWACPDLQSSVSSSVSGQMRKIPAAASSPDHVPLHSSSSTKTNTSGLKPTTEPPPVTVTDNELWSEMRRHQMLREELRQRRKHLESLMAEQQRRNTLNDSPFRSDTHETQSYSRDERTVATWGGSTQCPFGDDDDYSSEMGAEEDVDVEHDEGEESSSTDELHACKQKQRNYSRNNRDGLKIHREINGSPSPCGSRGRPRQQPQNERGSSSRAKRQENLRWAADLSLSEGAAPAHWQEQITHLQKQLNFSTTMCQTLLQDQQTLSYMLQALLAGPYGVVPNNVTSPQIPLIMHQLNQCYTQLAWQQNNVNRLKQVLNDLLRQQQNQSLSGQQHNQNVACDSASSSLFVNYPPVNTLSMSGLPNFSPFPTGFNFSPMFPSSAGDFQQNQAGLDQQHDPNISLKTEYMSFPPPLQRSPLNNAEKRFQSQPDTVANASNSSWLNSSLNRSGQRTTLTSDHPSQNSPSSSPIPHPCTTRDLSYIPDSQESVSSLPDRADPTTVTKTFRAGRKAAAQASLASRDKTPNTKSRRRRGRGRKNTASLDSDSVSSDSHFDQDRERSSQVKYKDLNQGLLDKLTQEKLDSKAKNSKSNDLSSAYAWRTPFLSNRIACTEVPDVSSDFSLFEALRETIYSEVATLISQNESRPHFLIELFHELQLLNTDYLRQRALYSLQDIVTRHLTEKSVADEQASSLGPAVWATGSQSELTPSESLATSDNDASEKIVTVKSNSVLKRVADRDSMDNESLLSTSSNLEPFASDDPGNTVIHLDKALARMREYERMKLRAECNTDNPEHSPGAAAAAAAAASALTQGAGHSSTDAHCPQIDTQQLDRQIKAIMTEVIPFLKEHVGEVCSHQLLRSVRRMVLKLTQKNDESKEFVQFFHRQLGGILQDSLSKFVGGMLQDCGEDLLVEISEILFNELAFFRLMQDLDQNTSENKHRTKRRSDHTSPKHSPHTEEAKTLEREKTFSPSYFDEDRDQDETEQGGTLHEKEEDKEKDAQSSEASEVEEEEGEGLPLSISLSKAETQALCNYGSGEDENEVEEMEEFEAGPVEVQTSLQASMDNTSEHRQGSALRNEALQETKSDLENSESSQLKSIKSEFKDLVQPPEEGREEAKTGSGDERDNEDCTVSPAQETPQSSDTASPDTESLVMINTDEAGSGNTSQRSDEEDFVKVEDLPLQMSVLCEEELCKRISEKQQNINLTAEILNENKDELTGLVGNAQALKEPETTGAQSA
ncbi:pericentriolar material 1 protein-like [Sinocyclocheilus anshuiensis]|uniref:pericentriolar material 1 protein-like n=1 Tax=Sinocyclocheilus anshuiensis TaxID=1608454 RepID=UPI0007B974B1|nr:PREDICTED: pericentriolar material 1 protein-like [Sinocyclocheilus anshuiensis]